ncbi:hypothetical protein ACFLZO_00225, partial [Patescibacteria group bacterium]
MRKRDSLTAHQKFGLGIFVVIAAATFVFGYYRIHKNIILPLYQPESYFTIRTTQELEDERQKKLKEQDTDFDGISDFDELYVFRTSPFLEDSDSDGIGDGDEITNQTDPNCPRGKTCNQRSIASVLGQGAETVEPGGGTSSTFTPSGPQDDVPAAMSEEAIMEIVIETFGDPENLTPEYIAEKLTSMESDELRTFLVNIGIPKDILDQTDDGT